MAQPDIEARLQAAITLAQNGQRADAQRELEAIVALQPELVTAWLWLATVAIRREDRIAHLQRALALDPNNETAQIAYAQLTGDIFVPPQTSAADAADELLSPAEDDADFFDLPEPEMVSVSEEEVIVVEMPPAPPPEPTPETSRRIALIVATAILVFAVGAFVLALLLDNSDDAAGGSPVSSETIEYFLTWEPTEDSGNSAPSRRPTRTPRYSPTPFPTLTALRLPPTWTPAPTSTPLPTATLAPTSTRVPTSEPFIAPAVQSVTAAFVQTSDAPAPARQTATAAIEQTEAAGTAAVQSPTPTLSAVQKTVNARFTQAAATSDAVPTQAAATPTPTDDEN